MDRQLVYPGAIPLDTDILNTNKNAMVALGKLASAILGSGTALNGLACTPNTPAALNVLVTPGEMYVATTTDATPYGSLAADPRPLTKQGIMLDTVTLACPAPTTAGQSINYLVQVGYWEGDTNNTTLPYYNASNPSQAYSGPSNSGTAQASTRAAQVVASVKAGAPAATGSQVTPAPDTFFVGAWVVTVAYGQTQITAGNITMYPGAPFIGATLLQRAPLASPALTGTPTAPTPAGGDSSTKIATTAFVAGANTASASKWQTARTVSITGDMTWSVSIDGSGNATAAGALANSGVSAGTYNNSATAITPYTVDAKGRITGTGTPITITPAWGSITGKPTTLGGFGITDALPLTGGVLTGDITTYRPGTPTTGAIFLGNQSGGGRYLYYDGSSYNLPGAPLSNNGAQVVTANGGTWAINISGSAATVSSVTSSQVLNATAGATAGAVGTYVFGTINGTEIHIGGTYAGSALIPSGVYVTSTLPFDTAGSGTASALVAGSAYLSGTWMAMGTVYYNSASSYARATLFLRIA